MATTKKQRPPYLQADDWFTIAPSNTVTFEADTSNNPAGYKIAAVFVGVGGDVSLTSEDGVTKIFKGIPTGTFMPVLAVRVNVTGTTATDMLGLVSGATMRSSI